MKNIISIKYFHLNIFAILFVLLVLSSCQKVINIDLNSASPQIVIEGNVTDQAGPYTVKMTKTVNFSETNVFPPVTGALVKISDNAGNSESLAETSPGIYTTSTLQGTPGREYSLSVTANGKNYTATSTMPYPVNIDTIEFQQGGGFGGRNKRWVVKFLDPAGIANYYALFIKVNNVIQSNFSTADDNLRDGDTITMRLPFPDNFDVQPGDSITVILESIDKNVREYFRLLNQLSNQNGIESAPPANPVSNISGGALGYFSAHADRKKLLIVP
jgi:hypothetical protein